MKGIREIKHRIKSVKNTAQITRAMQLVAASKMKKAQSAALAGRPYSLLMAEILQSLIDNVEHIKHPFFQERPVECRGVLIISTDKGLCGALNTNLMRHLSDIQGPTRFITMGRKAAQFLARSGKDVWADFSITDQASFSEVRPAAEMLIRSYLEGKIDRVDVLYTRFINTLKQEVVLAPLLPLSGLESSLEMLKKRAGKNPHDRIEDDRPICFEPNPQALIEALPELFIKQEIYQMTLEAKASEHSARMVAMKSATDNAKALVEDLTLEYNKARQAAITQEILEIAASTSNVSI